MRTSSIFKRSLVFLTCLCLMTGIASAGSHESDHNRKLTPDKKLIYAVKGIKNGVALFLVGMVNPIAAGLLVSAYNPNEANADLQNIDAALNEGANINYKEENSGYTALIYAAYKGYPGIAAHLVNRGASIEVKEDKDYNAYTMAQYYLDDYTKRYDRNERERYTEHFDAKKQSEMREYYQDYINRYQELVNLLKPLTSDRTMPISSWF